MAKTKARKTDERGHLPSWILSTHEMALASGQVG